MACLLALWFAGCFEYRGPYTKTDVEGYLTGRYPDYTINIRQKGIQSWECWFGELPAAVFQVWVGQGRYNLSAFKGIQVTQLFLITAAGKWGLYQGSSKALYMSYHMADLLHGYGAQITFDGIWRGLKYGPEIITMDRVIFYRFRHFQIWDHVPESRVCVPEELPARFVSTVLAAFRGIMGNGEK